MNQTGYVIKSLQPLGISLFYPGQVYKTKESAETVLKVLDKEIRFYYQNKYQIDIEMFGSDDYTYFLTKIDDKINVIRNIVYIYPVTDTTNITINSIINEKSFRELFGEVRLNSKVKDE